jgi:cell division transport system ATP-binding protein
MIVTRRLSKTYEGGVRGLHDVSLVIPQGDFVFLVGPNGAGKSTLIKLVSREEDVTSGSVLCFGHDVSQLSGDHLAEHRRRLGSVFQDPRLIPTKTVRENVLLPLEADGKSVEDAAERASIALRLARVEDLAERFPEELSGGQQQKVSIARALVNRPAAVLADEPTGNLSPVATSEVMEVFEAINKSGISVILATHNLEVVDSMERRVLALDSGEIVLDVPNGKYPEFLRSKAA